MQAKQVLLVRQALLAKLVSKATRAPKAILVSVSKAKQALLGLRVHQAAR